MSSSPKKILVPIDFSEQSLIALDQSYNLAKGYKAEVVLAHVIEDSGPISRIFSKEQNEEMEKTIRENLKKLAADAEKKGGVKTSIRVPRGKAYEEIVKLGETLPAELIIMGCDSSPSGLKKRFIGSTALRIVRESKVPVITIRGKHHRSGCKNIVLPLDLTKETKEKVSKAIELSNLFGGAAIHVVSVVQTSDEFLVNKLTRQLGQAKSFIEKSGVECSAEIIKGTQSKITLAQTIIDYANKVEGDLLMIMTQQEQNFTKYFIGSSAQEIINNSNIPVLSIVPSLKKDVSTGFLNI